MIKYKQKLTINLTIEKKKSNNVILEGCNTKMSPQNVCHSMNCHTHQWILIFAWKGKIIKLVSTNCGGLGPHLLNCVVGL